MQTESFLTGKSEFGLGKVKLCSKETQKREKQPKTAFLAYCNNYEYLLHFTHYR